jgi:hypothetical protein
MIKRSKRALASILMGCTLLSPCLPIAAAQTVAQPAAAQPAGPPNGTLAYPALVALFAAFNAWKDPKAVDGVVDYSPATVEARRNALRAFQARLPDFAVAGWDRHQQVDYLAVRAQLDQADFDLNISKPWARDPGMYVDELQDLAYTELPLKPEALAVFRARLRTIPLYLSQARVNLDSITVEYADLALYTLSHGDGV